MILGILSDSHGQHQRVACALRVLKDAGATEFVHCGDVGGERVFDELAVVRAHFVWGNCDDPDPALLRYVTALGLTPPATVPLWIDLEGRRIAVFHGHEPTFAALLRAAEDESRAELESQFGRCDYILHGHTHAACGARLHDTWVLNPGALQRAPTYSVATLDLKKDEVEWWLVDETDRSAGGGERKRGHRPRERMKITR